MQQTDTAVRATTVSPSVSPTRRAVALTSLGALGVVYGDIGTSPLYAVKECLAYPHVAHAVVPTEPAVLGVMSLVFWSLISVVVVKYLWFVLRADNKGEGGILAIGALVEGEAGHRTKLSIAILLALFGAGLLFGDGIITPAISVLGAMEGLSEQSPQLEHLVVPIAIAILVGLFSAQRYGTGRIGGVFGWIMLLWFVSIGVIGARWIAVEPHVLTAVDPRHAVAFFGSHGWHGFLLLGSVFLVVTGGEALYADMGHFGRKPITLAWYVLVLPALLLNYFGQGALLLRNPEAAPNVFYLMAPSWALIPLVVLSTLATIIASQALISGAFSITMQAQNLGFLPRIRVVHTSATEFGQIYIPFLNWALMLACIAVVVGFRTSSNLAAAYGIAVTSTMAITTLIFGMVARDRWKWPVSRVAALVGFFLIVDLAFLSANLVKIPQGGWFPLVAAVLIFTVMTTWKRGSRIVNQREQSLEQDLLALLDTCNERHPLRAPGVAVFMSANAHGAPDALVANLRYNGVIHEQVLLVNVLIRGVPHQGDTDRITVEPLGQGFTRVTLRYGFMEELNVPAALANLEIPGVSFDPMAVPYFISRTKVIPSDLPGMAPWREQIYSVMQRNAASAADFFRLPPAQVVEYGTSVEM